MIITNGKTNNPDDIRKLWDTCFVEDSISWRNWYFENIFNTDNVICAKQNNSLISMVHMNPYPILLHHSKINAFALSGVATEEEHRGQGYAGSLIKYALNKAYKLGYDFSFLYPFKYEYYEKFGYSLGYYKYKYKTVCMDKDEQSKMRVCGTYSTDEFAQIYAKHVDGKNGFVLRDSNYFDIHTKELECDGKIVCFKIEDDRGYFAIDDNEHTIEELAFEGKLETALKEIGDHYKKSLTFENLYDIASMVNIQEKHCMGRVVSVERLFKKLNIKNTEIILKIYDEIIEENNGVWHIFSSGGKTAANRTEQREDYSIDIAALTSIVTGISICADEDATKIQNILFKKSEPFIYEVC